MIKETNAPEETFAFGKMLGEQAKPGEVICLNGDLGVGKTVFTKGFAEGLGITEPVNSPTFTIVQQCDSGRMPLYHFDVYRIGDISEMDEVGYEDCFYGDGVTLIEWSNMIEEILPEHVKTVTIEKNLEKGFDYRKITVEDKWMRILGIESSSLVASTAIYEDGITMAEYTVDFKMTHSQTLLPMIDEMVKLVGIDLNTIDAIAVSGGPGSFTGLRIGSATAKGLGLALNKPLIHVPTLDATAYNLFGASGLICPIMDARRNQVYTGIYRFEKKFETVMDQDAMDMGELIEKLNAMGERVIFLGDGVPVYEKQIAEKMTVPYDLAPAHVNRQRAASVAALGAVYFAEGKTETAMEHKPDYLRKSQAEREREEREAKNA